MSSTTQNSTAQVAHPRYSYKTLEEFPFRKDFTLSASVFKQAERIKVGLAEVFDDGLATERRQNFATSVQAYQQHISTAQDRDSISFRKVLGFRPVPGELSSQISQLYSQLPSAPASIARTTYDKVVKFITSFSIMEHWLDVFGAGDSSVKDAPVIAKTLEDKHTKEVRVLRRFTGIHFVLTVVCSPSANTGSISKNFRRL